MTAPEPMGQLEGFVCRFGSKYCGPDGAVDRAALAAALSDLCAGDGAVVHAFTDDGGSVLTGLSYQTSIEHVLNAVVTGVAVAERRRRPEERLAGEPGDPLVDLIRRRSAELDDDGFAVQAVAPARALADVGAGARA